MQYIKIIFIKDVYSELKVRKWCNFTYRVKLFNGKQSFTTSITQILHAQ